jgi:hypothetical protein
MKLGNDYGTYSSETADGWISSDTQNELFTRFNPEHR